MNKKYDILGLGEILIDFTPAGTSEHGFPVYASNPGGGGPNAMAACAKLGAKCAFIGKVGNDSFGKLLRETLDKNDISTEAIFTDATHGTTLAFVTLDETGNRSFSFFRDSGADLMIKEDEITEELISPAKIFHHGSLSCTAEPAKSATIKALELAKKHNLIISYDPNLRPSLWKSIEEAKREIIALFKYSNIVKISEEEFEFLTGSTDYEADAKDFMDQYDIDLLFVTLGPKGAYYRLGDFAGTLSTYDVKVIDTTGSGDAFIGACLYQISKLNKDIKKLTKEELEDIVDFANACGSMAATKKGGIPSMPTIEKVVSCQNSINKVQ